MNNLPRSIAIPVVGLLFSAAGGYLSVVLAAEKNARETLPLKELRAFTEVFGRIKREYVEPVEDKKLLEDAIRGMLSGLDPHSFYLNREEYRNMQVDASGEFGGLGIEVGMENGLVKVIAPIDDTPAARAGIRAEDLITRIDGKPTKGMSLNQAVNTMRGEPGMRITLTISRQGVDRPFNLELERAIIQVASVKTRTIEPGYGYVRISHFQSRTPENLLSALDKLRAENKGQLEGLILDLRNNPGGVLDSAVGVSDAFLDGGLIVSTKGRGKDSNLRFKAGPDDVLAGAPIVVLVNNGSASASEIVAGALQHHKRAIVMGRPTFGKGSVQTIVSIDEATALKLTTARYYTPSGHSIQAQGIAPDIKLVEGEFRAAKQPGVTPLKEVDLNRHLDTGELPSSDDRTTDDTVGRGNTAAEKRPLAVTDYPLGEALNLLKGLNILGRRAKD